MGSRSFQKIFEFRSIQMKVMVSVALIFISIIGVVVISSNEEIKKTEAALTDTVALNEAQKQSENINELLIKGYQKITTISSVLSTQMLEGQNRPITREMVIQMIKNQIAGQNEFIGSATTWEPNAFDGKDESYKNAKYHDATGRFIPYIVTDGTNVSVEPSRGYDDETIEPGSDFRNGEWYLGPKDTKKFMLVGPYPYEIDGKIEYLTTLSSPIIADGEFYGVLTIDFTIGYIQKALNKANVFDGKGRVIAVTHSGIILGYSGNDTLVGKKISEQKNFGKTWKGVQTLLKTGKEVTVEENNKVRIMVPIMLAELGPVGAVIVDIEKSLLTERADKSVLKEGLIGLVGILLGLTILFFIIQTIAKPLKETSSIIEQIEHTSDFSIRIHNTQQDEAGIIARSVNSLLDGIQGNFRELIGVMGAVSQGDLLKRLPANKKGDLGELNSKTNKSLDLLYKTMQQIGVSTAKVDSGIDNMKRSTNVLASNNSEQAATIEEISSSIIEISNQTKANTENVDEAKKVVDTTVRALSEGNKQMDSMTKSMNSISSMNEEISKIIKTIDDIAFQTNLLALNAAVESARAGSHGKGFAVVAEEVRTLATRSANAARSTSEMIEKTISEVNAGVENTKQTEEHLKNITATVNEFANIVNSIKENSDIQSTGIEQINTSIQQVNKALQEIASASEKSSVASEALINESNQMKNLVSGFNI